MAPVPSGIPIVYLGPELLFRLDPLAVDGGQVRGSMPVGPWLADASGRAVAGALGVLVDDVLGYAINHRRDGRWSVSSEITMDLLAPLTVDAGSLHAATTDTLLLDGVGGHVTGTVTDAAGGLVARCSQRGRWVPFDGEFVIDRPPTLDLTAGCLEDLLGGVPVPVEGGATLTLPVGPSLANPLGNLHGGVSVCAADLVAAAAVTWDRPWVTESLRIHFVRPTPAGSDVRFAAVVRHQGRGRAVVEVTSSVQGRTCTVATVAGRPGLPASS